MSILNFDECAFVIVLIFVVSSIVRKQYKTRTNKIMFWLMVMILISAFTDLTAGVMNNYGYDAKWVEIFGLVTNYIYFLAHSMILPLYVLYVYSSIDVWHVFISKKPLWLFWVVVTGAQELFAFLNFVGLNVFRVTSSGAYIRGPWTTTYYVLAVVYVLWIVAALLRYKCLVNKDKLIVLLFLFAVIGFGVVVQFVQPTLLVESFSAALALLFFMVMVKREENQIDPVTGATKYNEGIERVIKNIQTRKPVMATLCKIVNYNNLALYLGQEVYNRFLHQTTDIFNEIAHENDYPAEVFYLESGLFAYLAETHDEELSLKVADLIKDHFASSVEIEGFNIVVDARICLVKSPEDISDFSTLFTLGTTYHHTLPKTKEVILYEEYKDDKSFRIRNEMKDILKRAVENQYFEMYYQPIYSIEKGKYISAEALIRLNDPMYGCISPGLFLPVAEITGDIHEIGNFVLKEVIEFVSKIDMEGLGLEYIEMNLSASQCIEVDLVDKIKLLLDQNKVSPRSISLELTETAANINPEIVDNNIKKLHEYGVRLALDDYGTGYSNIKRVTALPIDQVKLDKRFVDMMDDPDMWIVIQDTIKMLKEMGKEILVEGVEHEHVARKFMELNTDLFQGCEFIQGFYFCKPLPKNEFVEFIKKHK